MKTVLLVVNTFFMYACAIDVKSDYTQASAFAETTLNTVTRAAIPEPFSPWVVYRTSSKDIWLKFRGSEFTAPTWLTVVTLKGRELEAHKITDVVYRRPWSFAMTITGSEWLPEGSFVGTFSEQAAVNGENCVAAPRFRLLLFDVERKQNYELDGFDSISICPCAFGKRP